MFHDACRLKIRWIIQNIPSAKILSRGVVVTVVAQVEQGPFRLQHDGLRRGGGIDDAFFHACLIMDL